MAGARALVEDGDMIKIDIPNRSVNVLLSVEELAERRKRWKPKAKTPIGQ